MNFRLFFYFYFYVFVLYIFSPFTFIKVVNVDCVIITHSCPTIVVYAKRKFLNNPIYYAYFPVHKGIESLSNGSIRFFKTSTVEKWGMESENW